MIFQNHACRISSWWCSSVFQCILQTARWVCNVQLTYTYTILSEISHRHKLQKLLITLECHSEVLDIYWTHCICVTFPFTAVFSLTLLKVLPHKHFQVFRLKTALCLKNAASSVWTMSVTVRTFWIIHPWPF